MIENDLLIRDYMAQNIGASSISVGKEEIDSNAKPYLNRIRLIFIIPLVFSIFLVSILILFILAMIINRKFLPVPSIISSSSVIFLVLIINGYLALFLPRKYNFYLPKFEIPNSILSVILKFTKGELKVICNSKPISNKIFESPWAIILFMDEDYNFWKSYISTQSSSGFRGPMTVSKITNLKDDFEQEVNPLNLNGQKNGVKKEGQQNPKPASELFPAILTDEEYECLKEAVRNNHIWQGDTPQRIIDGLNILRDYLKISKSYRDGALNKIKDATREKAKRYYFGISAWEQIIDGKYIAIIKLIPEEVRAKYGLKISS